MGAASARLSRNVPRQARQTAPRDLFADLLHLVEAKPHFLVNLIHAAATDGVVGVVLQEVAPGKSGKLVDWYTGRLVDW